MRLPACIACTTLLLAGCSGNEAPPQPTSAIANASAASAAAEPAANRSAAARSAAASPFAARTGELLNPDDTAMVFLYYDLAGVAPPIDSWLEDDSRVQMARPADKAATRAAVRAELEAAAASVRNIGTIRLTMNANLSDYDPSYGEFTVRALSPSSEVQFQAWRQKVSLRFGNGRTAQTWQVPEQQAQAIRDKLGYYSASLDALLAITGVQPGTGGGTLLTDVVEYELRETRNGTTLGRVQVARP